MIVLAFPNLLYCFSVNRTTLLWNMWVLVGWSEMFVNKYLIRAANFAEGWLEEVKLTVNCSDKINNREFY